ncbi:MAG: N-acetylmuramoyl-L-alanine amidase [Acidimicrobiia bacterium]|nr:N-acetylmuramoyl-L-alanine amidase [Acidimicrobiia bacterium]
METTTIVRGRPILLAITVGVAIALFATAVSMMGVRTAQAEYTVPEALGGPTTKVVEAGPPRNGVALVPAGGVDLWLGPGREPYFTLHEGIALGFLHRDGDWLLVTTNCNDTAWVDSADTTVLPAGTGQEPGPAFDLSEAVVVLDPGHGDRDWGGVGPSGLAEKHVNLDIADRVRNLMEASRDIDWDTGAVTAGSAVPAFSSAVMTRDVIGPNDGDFEANLGYRATLATAANADAFVSIHNNTVPRFDTEIPGSEVFYSIGAEGSDRLAGIIYEELLLSFARFDADWQGGELLGARARIDPETDDDYYGLLRRATVPSVIVEGVYISEPDEEALLASGEFRQAYAEAVYRGVVRFLTTTDPGAESNRPEYFEYDAGTVSGNVCTVPAQP